MKRILLLALPLMAMCFASCEKDNGNGKTSGTNTRFVKTISGYGNDFSEVFGELALNTVEFEYDKSGRLSKVSLSGGKWADYEVYEYEYKDNEIMEKTFYRNDNESPYKDGDYTRYVLDDEGYLVQSEYYYDGKISESCQYSYECGQLAKISRMEFNQIGNSVQTLIDDYEYEWNNGDIVKSIQMNQHFRDEYECEYTYYANEDKDNISGSFDSYGACQTIYGLPETYLVFKGMASKHLIRTRDDGTNNYNKIVFNYEFDENGYVIHATAINGGEINPWEDCTIEYY